MGQYVEVVINIHVTIPLALKQVSVCCPPPQFQKSDKMTEI